MLKFTLRIGIAVILVLSQFSCNDEIAKGCSDQLEFAVSQQEGRITFVDGALAIRYHVTGTIDSFDTGVICNPDMLPEAFLKEGTIVVFSGNYYDDKGSINPTMVIGGEEFYYLELTELEDIL